MTEEAGSKDYLACLESTRDHHIEGYRRTVELICAELARRKEATYEDPDFRFGDVVGSQDFADERRWLVSEETFGFDTKFVLLGGNPGEWGMCSGNVRRKYLPEKLHVFERLSHTQQQRNFLEYVDEALYDEDV